MDGFLLCLAVQLLPEVLSTKFLGFVIEFSSCQKYKKHKICLQYWNLCHHFSIAVFSVADHFVQLIVKDSCIFSSIPELRTELRT